MSDPNNIEKIKKNKPTTFWDKIMLNSFYPPFANNYFAMHDSETAKEITKKGRDILDKSK